MNHRIPPAEAILKLAAVGIVSNHDGTRRGSFEIPVSKLQLAVSIVWRVYLSRINQEVAAPFRQAGRQQPVIVKIVREEIGEGVIVIERENIERRTYAGGAIVSVCLREQPEYSIISAAGVDYRDMMSGEKPMLEIIELLQTDESWPECIRMGQRITQSPEFDFLEMAGQMHLVVDNTEGPDELGHMLWDYDRIDTESLVLTQERTSRYFGGQHYTPRKDVIFALVDAFQTGRVQVAEDLSLAQMLETALGNLSMRSSDETSAIIVAVALTAWKAAQELPFDDYPDFYNQGDDLSNWGLK